MYNKTYSENNPMVILNSNSSYILLHIEKLDKLPLGFNFFFNNTDHEKHF